MKCRSCGTEIAANALICYKCGTATAGPHPAASAAPLARGCGCLAVGLLLGRRGRGRRWCAPIRPVYACMMRRRWPCGGDRPFPDA